MTRRILALGLFASLALSAAPAAAQPLPNARYNSYAGGYVSPALMNTQYGAQVAETVYAVNSSTPFSPYSAVNRASGDVTTITPYNYNPAAGQIGYQPTRGAAGGRTFPFTNAAFGTYGAPVGSTTYVPNPFTASTVGTPAARSSTVPFRLPY